MSHDVLDDLLADVPRHVIADAGGAWRAGTNRRRRRNVCEALAVAVAVGVVGLGLVRLDDHRPPPPAGQTVVVDGYPSSVPWPWRRSELPDRPGPMAGVLEWSEDGRTGWSVVAASGRSWVLPQLDQDETFQPTLSDDGRWLGLLRADNDGGSTLVLRDLVTDDQREFPEIGSNRGDAKEPFMVFTQVPSFWSPDASTLLVTASPRHGDRAIALLLTTSGDRTELKNYGSPVGWQDDEHIVWMRRNGEIIITDRAGQVVDHLTGPAPSEDWGYSQWSGRVSPDGDGLAVFAQDGLDSGRLRVVSLDGGEVEQDEPSPRAGNSSPVWQGDRVLVWDGHRLVDPASDRVVVELSDHWPSPSFGMWAPDALAGPDRGGPGLLDWRYWPNLWWWPWLLGLVVGTAVAFVVWSRKRRFTRTGPRSGPTPGAPSSPSSG